VLGWPSTSMQCCLRLSLGTVQYLARLIKLTRRRGEAAVAGLNEARWAKAAGNKLLTHGTAHPWLPLWTASTTAPARRRARSPPTAATASGPLTATLRSQPGPHRD